MGIRHAEPAADGCELGTGSGHTIAEVGAYARCADPIDSGSRIVGCVPIISSGRWGQQRPGKPMGSPGCVWEPVVRQRSNHWGVFHRPGTPRSRLEPDGSEGIDRENGRRLTNRGQPDGSGEKRRRAPRWTRCTAAFKAVRTAKAAAGRTHHSAEFRTVFTN